MATKEVYFDVYCPQCVHFEKLVTEDPCFDCLNYVCNYDSYKPVKFEPKVETKEGKSA